MASTSKTDSFIYNALIQQINQLKLNYSKLLNVRIDFHYTLGHPENLNKAYQDMAYLYHVFKRNHENIIGCQFVLEYSKEGRLHIHALFFIDGQKHQKYYPFYLWLNEFWLNVITGASHTVDCNDSNNYKYPIVGESKSYDDVNYDKGMMYLAEYFAKEEQKTNIPHFYRYFASQVTPKSSRGRPRAQNINLLPFI